MGFQRNYYIRKRGSLLFYTKKLWNSRKIKECN